MTAFTVVHRTEYSYDAEVSASYGEARLQPRESQTQVCYSSALSVDPYPEDYRDRRDFFGNRVAHYAVLQPHRALTIVCSSAVATTGPEELLACIGDRPWDEVAAAVVSDASEATIDARQYRLPSPAAADVDAAADYVGRSFPVGRPLVESLLALLSRMKDDFEYAPGVTGVDSTVDEVVTHRSGVCQDFAHLALSGLRRLGLAARYVSGYLENGVPGPDELRGADASHAWVSVYVPGCGWLDVDPTNDQLADDRYITAAWGRDYRDVPPVKGVLFGDTLQHRLSVSVEVHRVPESAVTNS